MIVLAAFFVLVKLMGMNKFLGQFVVTAGATILSYHGHKHYSFRRKAESAEARGDAAG